MEAFFPHLVTILCRKAGVPMTSTEHSLKSSKVIIDVGESSHPKLDWMILWMQESGPIFQEFARQNNIRVPNYTPDMFRPTNTEQQEEVHENEERGEDENDGSEEMYE
ncbi:hypothetical protein Gogos_020086 [Gossypium gossypioides]|uniref:Uncharacterized protein n=1 Tax=Gossypium gossypioides TaxID=34282 RepID=A0A7J9CYP0_GOSGO|nr:hypothetical protein [Gossypium gossypioides]